MTATSVLVVDDQDYVARALAAMVRTFGHIAVLAHSAEQALERFDAGSFDVVLTDVRMRGLDGFDLLGRLRERSPQVPVVLITAGANISDAMNATNAGAFDYISKPVDLMELGALLQRAIDHHRLLVDPGEAEEPEDLAEPTQPATEDMREIVGRSRAMLQTFMKVSQFAKSDASMLVLGEHGTGKELVARMLHDRSPRRDRPFVVSNVASIAPGLAESELFGHMRGSFTGAHQDRVGLFEQASGGTLFLDEIGELQLPVQAKLLRVLQEKRVKRVGANDEIPADVRLICATNRNLRRMIAEREFREDLFFRIAVVEITLPPLRERTEDIPRLARFFLARFTRRLGRETPPRLSPAALAALCEYRWPGNVRELENVMQRIAQSEGSAIVTPEMLQLGGVTGDAEAAVAPAGLSESAHAAWPGELALDAMPTLREVRDRYVRQILDRSGGDLSKAAQVLGVSRKTLQRFERGGVRAE